MDSRKYIPLFLMLVGVMAAACVAQTWDATKDFGPSNPNGSWSYGSGVTGTSFTLYPFYNTDCADYWGVEGIVCWTAELYYHDPLVSFNTTGEWLDWSTIVGPPNVLIVHPAPNWEPADSIVQWRAPADGAYRISGFFEILDAVSPTGIIGLVYRNGTQLYRGELLGPPAQYPDTPGGREDFYFASLSLKAGDVISFGVNSDGNFYYDSTGFNATIVTPPSAPPCAVCSQQGGAQ
ncbi:MAG: hypothetical protein ACLPND_06600 [Candidatus Korobacteraceae bacterium]